MQIEGRAFSLNHNYQKSRMALQKSMQRLSTGDRYAVVGEAPSTTVSISERIRHSIARAQSSVANVQRGINFLKSATEYLDTGRDILHRMQELAATASDGLKSQADRDGLEIEFQSLKAELSDITRTALWDGKQLVGRDSLVSYDGNTEKIRFWLPDGSQEQSISRDFGSNAKDALNQEIGFDSSADFTMSRDGKSLFFLGTVTGDGAGVRRIKRYDIDAGIVYTSTDTYDSADKLFVDESGSLYINDDGTISNISTTDLTATATAATGAVADTEFSVYKGEAYYYRDSDNRFVKEDINTGATTQLTGVITFAAGDHDVSASGRYIAEEDAAGQIRVLDTRTGTEATLVIGAANTVVNLQFNEDGDRIYYNDQSTNTLKYITVETDEADNVQLATGSTVVKGKNNNSFLGLDLGGSNHGSAIQMIVADDAPHSLWYEAADMRLYNLGLANTHIDSYTGANTAIEDIKSALTTLNYEAAKIGAAGVRFEHMLNTQRQYIANAQERESFIRDVDMAEESTRLSTAQVKNTAAQAILAQFQNISRNVLGLLQ